MGLFDRAKRFFGIGGEDEGDDDTDKAEVRAAPRRPDPRGGRRRGERPPLAEAPATESRTVEDALAAREAGDRAGAQAILREIDRGGGLRGVLRAAAALEEGDTRELEELLPRVATEAAGWRLSLQVAAALDEPEAAAPYWARAEAEGAPAWAAAWSRAMSSDEAARREGLVDLLFADAALARTVAARDLAVDGAVVEVGALERYASFAHGRDCIRRFGARAVADVVDRAISGPLRGAAR